jgi:phenylacetyl-CoA:acceptor oxidoreductase subunit 2
MSYGPNPWQQTHWDWRAAGNFIAGGAGAGLIVVTVLSAASGRVRTGLLLAGLALVGLGLFCVWLEIGRPWRAMNVFRQPGRSWMSREAIVAALLFPVTVAAAFVWPALGGLALVLALAFVYCQSRMLVAARGIPAWRSWLVSPLIVATGLAEGMGIFVAAAPVRGLGLHALLVLAALALLRLALWLGYRQRVVPTLAPRSRAALHEAGMVLLAAGTLLPLAALAGAAFFGTESAASIPVALVAGLGAWLAGGWFKFALITRAAFNQGFALQRLPVRGVRRS